MSGACVECRALLGAGDPRRKFCGPPCRNRHNNRAAKRRSVATDEHGTTTGYVRGCRCDACRAAIAAYSRQYRAQHPKPPAPPRQRAGIKLGRRRPEEHGTSSGYAYGCRCQPCTSARTRENAEWARRNPDRFRRAQQRYRRRNPRTPLRALAPYDDEALAYVDVIRHDPCVYCGGESDTVDHIAPVSISRSSSWDNLAPACRSCNSAKGTRSLLDFLLYRLASDREVTPA